MYDIIRGYAYSSTGHSFNALHFNRPFLKVSQIWLKKQNLDNPA